MNVDTPPLTCPKCGGAMRSVERSGVVIDVCSGCRGVFLDRGELERVMDAEGAYYDGRGPIRGAPDERTEWSDQQRRGRPGQRRRGGFLGDLLDFGD